MVVMGCFFRGFLEVRGLLQVGLAVRFRVAHIRHQLVEVVLNPQSHKFAQVACIPFISPAYMAMTFGALIVSHIYLYSYDRVGRWVGVDVDGKLWEPWGGLLV